MGVPAGPAKKWRDHLRALGLTQVDIVHYARQSGFYLAIQTVRNIGRRATIDPYTERAVLAVKAPWTAIGLQRRIQALYADGFPLPYVAYRVDSTPNTAALVCELGLRPRRTQVAEAICELYDRLAGSAPGDLPPEEMEVARSAAAALGYAPSIYWDHDTIDVPEAFPDWTGACGTTQGADIHYKRDINVVEPDEHGELRSYRACAPCRAARYAVRGYVSASERV